MILEEGNHQAYAQQEAAALAAVAQKAQASAFTCSVGQTDAWPAISFQTGKLMDLSTMEASYFDIACRALPSISRSGAWRAARQDD